MHNRPLSDVCPDPTQGQPEEAPVLLGAWPLVLAASSPAHSPWGSPGPPFPLRSFRPSAALTLPDAALAFLPIGLIEPPRVAGPWDAFQGAGVGSDLGLKQGRALNYRWDYSLSKCLGTGFK